MRQNNPDRRSCRGCSTTREESVDDDPKRAVAHTNVSTQLKSESQAHPQQATIIIQAHTHPPKTNKNSAHMTREQAKAADLSQMQQIPSNTSRRQETTDPQLKLQIPGTAAAAGLRQQQQASATELINAKATTRLLSNLLSPTAMPHPCAFSLCRG